MWDENIHFTKKARERGVKNVVGNMIFSPPEAEFFVEIRNTDKILKSFPPCYSQSPLQLCLDISISSNSHNLL
jgi:hypothetical protein